MTTHRTHASSTRSSRSSHPAGLAALSRLVALAPLLGAGTIAAQEDGTVREIQITRQEPLAFQEGPVLGGVGETPDAEELLRDLASARVTFAATADATAAATWLDAAWLEASHAAGYPDQAAVLVELAIERSRVAVLQGDLERARRTLGELFVPRDHPYATSFADRLAEVPADVVAAVRREAERDGRLRARLEDLTEERPVRREQGQIHELVLGALAAGDRELLVDLGIVAFEPVLERVAATRSTFPRGYADDPLSILGQIDSTRTLAFVRGSWEPTSYLWVRRVVRLLESLPNHLAFPQGTDLPDYQWIVARLVDMPEWAVQGASLAPEAAPYLEEPLLSALLRGLEREGVDFALPLVRGLAGHTPVAEPARPVLEAALAHPHPMVRVEAAKGLVAFPDSSVLLTRLDDPEPAVRELVALSLGKHEVREPGRAGSVLPELSEAQAEALPVLLADESERVRARALRSFEEQLADAKWRERPAPLQLDEETWLRLARDPSVEVRERAADLAFLASGAAPLSALRVLLEDPDPRVRSEAISSLRKELKEHPAVFLGLEDELLLHFLGRMHALEIDPTPLLVPLREDEERRRELVDDFLAGDQPFEVQLQLATVHAHDGSDPVREAILAVLHDPSWSELAGPWREQDAGLPRWARKLLWSLAQQVADPVPLLLSCVRDRDVADAVAETVVVGWRHLVREGPGTRPAENVSELADAVLDRWLSEDRFHDSVEYALGDQARLGADADREALVRAARMPGYARAAVSAMSELADPAFVEVLGDCIEAPWVGSNDREIVQKMAASALVAIGTDEAAEELLRGLSSTDPAVRERCFAGLRQIELARAERQRLAAKRAGLPTEGEALAELIGLLDAEDAEVRALAVRSLAAFDAPEILPLLLRRLADPDERVREAVRDAVRRRTSRDPASPPVPESRDGDRDGER